MFEGLSQDLWREKNSYLSWTSMPALQPINNAASFLWYSSVILSQAANIFLVIVMIYIFQYIFNSQFSCSCTEKFHFIVVIYVGLIPLLLFLILKLFKQTRTKVSGAVCYVFLPQIFQVFGICLFWGGFILLDGDLYLCLATKHSDTLRELPCKKNLTLQEMSIITIHKNWSQVRI